MTSETLREAARVLRERAEAATSGPWTCTVSEYPGLGGTVDGITDAGCSCDYSCNRTDPPYIATMHPGIGLALADWLDVEAYHVESHECAAQCEPDGCERVEKATTVARAILGGPA